MSPGPRGLCSPWGTHAGECETRWPTPAEVCAETHCSVLVKKATVFEKCHAVVNPKPFYKVGRACWPAAPGEPGRREGRHPCSYLPAEVCVPSLQLRGDLPVYLRCPGGLRPHMCLAGRPALGLEKQCGQLQYVPGQERVPGSWESRGHNGAPGPRALVLPGHP